MLWTKSTNHKMGKNFRIPDTVIYKLKFPTQWIFTSKIDGVIKNKTEIHITKENILKSFLKKNKRYNNVLDKPSEIVA